MISSGIIDTTLRIYSVSDPLYIPRFADEIRFVPSSPRSEITLGGFDVTPNIQDDDSYIVLRVVRDERTKRDQLVADTPKGRVRILWDAVRSSIDFNPWNAKQPLTYQPRIPQEGKPTIAGATRFLTTEQLSAVIEKRLKAKGRL